jgi:hypothetical protein
MCQFLQLRNVNVINIRLRACAALYAAAATGAIMEDTVQKSCWGVTVKALCGFAGVLALAYLFGTI